MCYAEECECEGCEERPSVVITVVYSKGEKESFVVKPRLREEDLKRSKKILRRNLKIALASH